MIVLLYYRDQRAPWWLVPVAVAVPTNTRSPGRGFFYSDYVAHVAVQAPVPGRAFNMFLYELWHAAHMSHVHTILTAAMLAQEPHVHVLEHELGRLKAGGVRQSMARYKKGVKHERGMSRPSRGDVLL